MTKEGTTQELTPLQEGQVVCHGNYILKRLLRDDVTGQVWLGAKKDLPEDVRELRFLPHALGEQPAERPHLRGIVTRLVDLQHPGLAHIHGYIRENNEDIICQERFDAPSLTDITFDFPGRAMPESAVLAWLPQVLDALEYAHRKVGMAHGHLKPQSILLKDGCAKIIEFQLARVVRDILIPAERQGGRDGATLAHASPERLGGKDLGPAEDIYSLGAILYEILAGEAPFAQNAAAATPPPLRERRQANAPDAPPLSDTMVAAVEACLSPNLVDRPHAIKDLRQKLGLDSVASGAPAAPVAVAIAPAQRPSALVQEQLPLAQPTPPQPEPAQASAVAAAPAEPTPKSEPASTAPEPEKPKPAAGSAEPASTPQLFPAVEKTSSRRSALPALAIIALLGVAGYAAWEWWNTQRSAAQGESTAGTTEQPAPVTASVLPTEAATSTSANPNAVAATAAAEPTPAATAIGSPLTPEAQKLASARKEEIRTLLTTANEALQRGDFEQSLVNYSTVVSLTREYVGDLSKPVPANAGQEGADPQFIQGMRDSAAYAWHGRGECNFEQGRYTDALKEFQNALEIFATNDQTLARIAQCQLELRQNLDAKVTLDKALELNPDQANAILALGRYQVVETQDYTAALECLDRAIAIRSELAEAYYWKAKALGGIKDFAKEKENLLLSEAGFTQILQQRPLAARWLAFRGSSRLWLNRFAPAVEDFTEVIRMLPNYGFAYANRGYSFLRLGELQKAITDLDQATRLDSDLPSNFVNRGDAYLRLGKAREAAEDYTRALTLDASNPVGWHNRAMAHLRLGRYQSAIADFDKAIGIDPEASIVYLNKANAQFAAQEYPAAIRTYAEVVSRDPKNAAAFRDRASAQYAVGEYEGAIGDLDKAIALDNTDAVSFFRRGAALDASGQYEKAVQDFTSAIALNAKDPRYFKARADAYSTLGELDKAEADFKQGEALEQETGIVTQAAYGPL